MSDNNIIQFTGITKLELPVDKVLDGAKEKLKSVVILGWDKDDEMYFASTSSDGGDVLWLLEQCKLALLKVPCDDD